MATYTEDDLKAAATFAQTNTQIRFLQKMYDKQPHIVSWLKYNIRDATDKDYYIPYTLKGSAKVITIEMTKESCELLSCNPVKEKDVCNPLDQKASYYYVGDDSYDIQCQPACFNTTTKPTYNEDGTRGVDTPMLNWFNNKCRIVNSSVVSYLEKTYYRDTTHYKLRVNDMPTGFSRTPYYENAFGSGFTYKTNETYCKYYDRTLKSDGSCEMTTFEYFVDAIIGQTLINSVKSGIRMLTNNGIPFELPKNLPKFPAIKDIHTVDGWKKNINKNFIKPELIDTTPKIPQQQQSRSKRNIITEEEETIHDIRRNAEKNNTNYSNLMKQALNIETHEVKIRSKRSTSTTDDGELPNEEDLNKKEEEAKNKLLEMLLKIYKGLLSTDFLKQAAIDIVASKLLDKLKKQSLKLVEKLLKFLSSNLGKFVLSISEKVFLFGLRNTITHMVVSMAFRLVAKVAIALAKILAAAASVIGWILIGTMLLDLMFSLWDPFGYQNLFPPNAPHVIMQNGELAFRSALSTAECNYEFENLASTILTDDEILEIQIESFLDTIIYLDALVINSEGSRIDKGDEFPVNQLNSNDILDTSTRAHAKQFRMDNDTYDTYNHAFLNRVKLNNYLNKFSLFMIGLSGSFYLLQLPLLCIFCIIIAVILLAISRLELQDSLLVDLINNYIDTKWY